MIQFASNPFVLAVVLTALFRWPGRMAIFLTAAAFAAMAAVSLTAQHLL